MNWRSQLKCVFIMPMGVMEIKKKNRQTRRRIAWGVTGSGDKLPETVEVMKRIKAMYKDKVEIQVYLSKAAEQVLKYYKLSDDLRPSFDRIWAEVNANSPFLAGQLQLRIFEFLLIAPATSNTVAKIAIGIADSLLSNSAIMALKAFIPVYIMPSDYREGIAITKLPSGREMQLRVRKEDANNTEKLTKMDGLFVLEKPENIYQVFEKHFGLGKP
jgi:archaeoflavoprotein AfpA